MSSWSLQLEGKVFDGVEVVPTSHVDMQDKILNPDPEVYHSVICLYVHRFKTQWKFVVQYLFGEAQRVSSPFVSGRAVACSRLLLCPEFIPNWYLACMSILVTVVPRGGVSFSSRNRPGCTGFLIQMLT